MDINRNEYEEKVIDLFQNQPGRIQILSDRVHSEYTLPWQVCFENNYFIVLTILCEHKVVLCNSTCMRKIWKLL